ncbi:MAG: ATP-binding protein [Streptosporangiaceae bacterium]|jgi:anti-sigma regulatory factor (Ser/Thr protein kinase)
MSRSGGWPLSSFLELGALDGAAPSARLHALHLAREWGLAELADETQLVVSELVTNAVRASRSMAHAAVGLWLASDQSRVAITVWDASSDPPQRVEACQDAENGRGLLLVEEVSTQWGWYAPVGADHTPDAGKLVWALVS